jgi:DNA-directed RNA polymerase I subunit RPA2
MHVKICRQHGNGQSSSTLQKYIGRMPIMVRSKRCSLGALGATGGTATMQRHGEDPAEMGGYFIINGNEKVIRILAAQRRNYPLALKRDHYQNSGKGFTPYALSIRCCRPDQTSVSLSLHALNNGDCSIRFSMRKQQYFLPVVAVMRALVDTTDREIYERIVQQDVDNTFITDRVESMLRESHKEGIYSREQCLAFIGSRFRTALDNVPDRWTDVQIGEHLLKKYVLVHLTNNQDKFNLLVFMIRKLYALVSGDCAEDNPDAPNTQELLLPGHLMLMTLKEKLQEWLANIKAVIAKDLRMGKSVNIHDETYFKNSLNKTFDVGSKLEYFLSTGNLKSPTGLDLKQATGFSIVADRLNFLRFLSHFRSIHRGQFFTEMRTTQVRKLLPEAWGFVCPVHTPDGGPCGLLNHLAHTCHVTNTVYGAQLALERHVITAGPLLPAAHPHHPGGTHVPVLLDGKFLGSVALTRARHFVETLRKFKLENSTPNYHEAVERMTQRLVAHKSGSNPVPPDMEISYVSPESHQYACIYLSTSPTRMMRPVLQLESGKVEWIGTLEQLYLRIALHDEPELRGYSHQEIMPTNILSVVANLTPFSDFNQSPRNMYQCQMGKQTMGTPCYAYTHRTDNKLYRIQTPQAPIVRTSAQDRYCFDEYAHGTNAVVAVISYTGYDMEDAMIINKGAYDRGFKHGTIYKSQVIDVTKEGDKSEGLQQYFHNLIEGTATLFEAKLEEDGLPAPGTKLQKGDPFYCVWDEASKRHIVTRYKSSEPCIVDQVLVLGMGDTPHLPSDELSRVSKVVIKLRYRRTPWRGDKFSSRHGQKGVMSQVCDWSAITRGTSSVTNRFHAALAARIDAVQ